jgi:Kef-type K+ transport system membrane component KefB
MFTAGMHVPLRQPGLLAGLRGGTLAALVTVVLAVPAAMLVSAVTDTGHRAIYVLLLATGSAAILTPVLTERRLLGDPRGLAVLAQVVVADVVSIVAVPLVLEQHRAVRAAGGSLLVAAAILIVFCVPRLIGDRGLVHRLRRLSKRRGWALDLRVSLLVLFALAWLAQRVGSSVLIASFGVGLVVASVGGPKRLTRQVAGIGAGFFVPLFFVVLGSRIDLRALSHGSLVELAVLLVAANVAVHLAAAAATRQPLAAGLAATVQLGVPAAIVTLGLQNGVLTAGEAAAILASALATLALCAAGVARLARLHPSDHPSTVDRNRSPT